MCIYIWIDQHVYIYKHVHIYIYHIHTHIYRDDSKRSLDTRDSNGGENSPNAFITSSMDNQEYLKATTATFPGMYIYNCIYVYIYYTYTFIIGCTCVLKCCIFTYIC
jgi:hypothetical protein